MNNVLEFEAKYWMSRPVDKYREVPFMPTSHDARRFMQESILALSKNYEFIGLNKPVITRTGVIGEDGLTFVIGEDQYLNIQKNDSVEQYGKLKLTLLNADMTNPAVKKLTGFSNFTWESLDELVEQ